MILTQTHISKYQMRIYQQQTLQDQLQEQLQDQLKHRLQEQAETALFFFPVP